MHDRSPDVARVHERHRLRADLPELVGIDLAQQLQRGIDVGHAAAGVERRAHQELRCAGLGDVDHADLARKLGVQQVLVALGLRDAVLREFGGVEDDPFLRRPARDLPLVALRRQQVGAVRNVREVDLLQEAGLVGVDPGEVAHLDDVEGCRPALGGDQLGEIVARRRGDVLDLGAELLELHAGVFVHGAIPAPAEGRHAQRLSVEARRLRACRHGREADGGCGDSCECGAPSDDGHDEASCCGLISRRRQSG
jgi:hypothetical protein